MIFAFFAAMASSVSAKVDAVAAQSKLAGVILVAKGDRVLVEKGYGTVAPVGGKRHDPKSVWRLASITKQVTAALLVKDDLASLDLPLAGPPHTNIFGGLSMRQMLTHHTGLPNPDETKAGEGGVPSFYLNDHPDFNFCLGKAPVPGGAFKYNNCDYLLAGIALPGSLDAGPKWPAGMRMARAGEMGVPGFVGGKPEPHYELASFGAAGGLVGTARSVFNFNRALMTGKLLSSAARAELWKPEGGQSYQALGQWVFPGHLAGCVKPKRIVQRDGEIGGVQTRNYILPDDDLVVIVFTNRSSDDFPIGEIWQGKGFAYDLLSAAACS